MKNIYLKTLLFLPLFVLAALYAAAQGNPQWTPVNYNDLKVQAVANTVPAVFKTYQADWQQISQPFYNNVSPGGSFNIVMPDPSGNWMTFTVTETEVLSKEAQQSFPDIKTYKGFATQEPAITIRITLSNGGLSSTIHNGGNSYSITPVYKNNPGYYFVYYTKDAVPGGHGGGTFECTVKDTGKSLLQLRPANMQSIGDCQLRTYRIAVAATDEYTAASGSVANAMVNIATTINNVNAIYERDAAIHFTLVTTSAIVFNTGGSDPYPTQSGPDGPYIQTNTSTLNSIIGVTNYDVGIVFNADPGWTSTGAKGIGSEGGACDPLYKGSAAAGGSVYTGSLFDNVVAHEIGHLFNAEHTYDANNGGCAGNYVLPWAYEPGSGSTIMSYAGVCPGNDYQNNTDPYFSAGSLQEILSYAINNATCAVLTPLSNTAPTVTVSGAAYTIPVSTPFILTASATDPDNNSLTYCWEQMDLALAATSTSPDPTATTGPMFRSFPPASSGTRYFPNLPSLTTSTATPYEVLPSVSRTLNFRVTVRDNAAGGGCLDSGNVVVTTNAAAGPFTVTSQPTAVSLTANGSNTFTVTWNVAGTNAAPINCSHVNILYSTDGGATYSYTLASNISNNGSATILVPNINTCGTGRIMVAAVGNIFFNINAGNITILSTCTANGATFSPDTAVSYSVGSSLLNFSLAPQYGTVYTSPIAASILSTDPTMSGSWPIGTSSCFTFGGITPLYHVYNFTANLAGNYTFTASTTSGTFTPIINLYKGSFNPAATCANILGSSYTNPGFAPVTVSLCAGAEYSLVVYNYPFGSSSTGPYSIAITPAAGGSLYTNAPAPGAGFTYAYVIADSNGIIKAINTTADLSNSSVYTSGNYTIYGISYENGTDLSPYVGGAFSALTTAAQNMVSCSNISTDKKPVLLNLVLSIDLLSFNGTLVNHHSILNWVTSSEQNNKGFEVMRSYDGQSYTDIGFVNGAGTSNLEHSYSFNDPTLAESVQYYKLVQVDFNNDETLSPIVLLRDAAAQTFISNTYFSATTNSIIVNTGNMNISGMNITIVDGMGQIVRTLKTSYQNQSIDIANLAQGVYFIRITDGAGQFYYSNKLVN